MKKALTPEMENYFIANAYKESVKKMCKKFGVSPSVCHGVFKQHNGLQLPEGRDFNQ